MDSAFWVLATLLAMAAVVSWAFLKTRKIHMAVEEVRENLGNKLENLFRQEQFLALLHAELDLDLPLPPAGGWAASPDFLLLLARHARAAAPAVVVECGSGVSTVVMARCLQLNGGGHVYSLEHDSRFAAKTREDLERYGVAGFATVLDAPLRPVRLGGRDWPWYGTEDLPGGDIDLLIVDGPPMPVDPLVRYPAGPVLFPRMRAGGTVFMDDTDRPGEREIAGRYGREFPDFTVSREMTEKGCLVLTRGAG
ncbi:MAG: class I SAM-dependent methyltransferase [Hyphomicrobiales bacterium]|nr:class I SAM-dependent methyltransferase [Hyphomicrobiales bacterium]